MIVNIVWSLALLLLSSTAHADPWGKDADIAQKKCSPPCQENRSSPLTCLAEALIEFHQEVISPADGPRSHFIPSSSQYALDAIKKYGFFQGVAMGCDRLMRENEDPWVYRWTRDGAGKLIKYDPVP